MNKSYPDSDKLEPEFEDPQMPLKVDFLLGRTASQGNFVFICVYRVL